MSATPTHPSTLLILAGLAGSITAGTASASVLTPANVIAARGLQVPGMAPGVTWGALNNPSVAADGRVLFSGGLVGVPAVNNLGIFTGTSAANVATLIQSGQAAPGGPAGATLDLAGSSSGFQAGSAKINADGLISFVSLFTGGGAVPNVDNWGVFTGTASGGVTMAVRRGAAAPGTAGAVINSPFSTGPGGLPLNGSGHLYFGASLTGGDVLADSNNSGIFGGAPGSLSLIARRGAAAPGVSGGTFGALSNPFLAANRSGQLLFSNTLNATGGVTSANDSVIYMHTPGSGLTLMVREGDAAPGTAGATFGGSFLLTNANFNNAGQAAVNVTLTGGDVVGTTNSSAVYVLSASGPTLAWRAGAAAPGTDAQFLSTNSFGLSMTNAGTIALPAALTGGTTTSTNDSGIWYGPAGSLQMIAREGNAVPTLNATFGNMGTAGIRANGAGQLAFNVPMLSSDTNLNNKLVLMAYDPTAGLFPVIYTGEQIEIAPGVFKTVSGFQYQASSNGDGSPLALSETGWLTLKITTTDSTDVIVRYAIPTPTSASLLAVGGMLMARRRRCAAR